MNSSDIEQRLASAIQSDNIYEGSAKLVEELEKAGASLEVVEPILHFMEAHPEEDFGAPGPLVHFMENSFGHFYTEELVRSLQRKPAVHTLLMLHRILNDTEENGERKRYLDLFRKTLTHPGADEGTRETAARYLGYHGETA
jgi:hypothetical protein